MDHIGVLKRAWRVTWRYRILWLFGLFAGGIGSGGGGGGGGNVTGTGDIDALPMREIQRVGWWLQDNIAFIAAAAAFFFVLALGLFILSIAAKGGLVHLVNEAEEERAVRGMDGWTVGFRNWFRVLGIGLVLYVPFLVLAVLFVVATIAPLIAAFMGNGQPGAEVLIGACGGFLLGVGVLILVGILVALLDTLAVRHAVIEGTGVFRSIGGAWRDVRTRFKDVIVMWLLMLVVGIGFGIAIGVVAAMFGFAIVAAVFSEAYVAAGVIAVTLFVFLLLPGAIYGAFTSAVWTIFFRRLTGREVVEAPATPGYLPPLDDGVPSGSAPPSVPAAPDGPSDAPRSPAPPGAPRAPGPPIARPQDAPEAPEEPQDAPEAPEERRDQEERE